MSRTITESQVRKLIQEELFYQAVLEEGIWDDVKSGTKKLISATTKQVARSGLAKKARQAFDSLSTMPDEVKQVISALKKGMAKTGEKINYDDTLKLAKEIGNLNVDKMGAVLAQDLKGPVHAKAETLSESEWYNGLEPCLNEINVAFNECINSKKDSLNESGLIGTVGLSLAGFGGLLFALKGLRKLALWLGAEKTADVLHKVHHVLHNLEEQVIATVVPTRLSYVVYRILVSEGLRLQQKQQRVLTFEEYRKGMLDVKPKVEKLVYSALLVFLAWNGIKAAIQAGISLLGFAEGTASVIKGAEIAQAAAYIGDIVDLGLEEL